MSRARTKRSSARSRSSRHTSTRCARATVTVGIASPASATSIEPAGTRCLRLSTMALAVMVLRFQTLAILHFHDPRRRDSRSGAQSAIRLRAHLHLVDLLLQLDDAVDQRFGARWATRHEDVHRHDLLDTLDDRVVVEDAADRGTGTHRDHVFRL